ncbi:MAG: M20/M25/M40 family metallo-hydrolase [Gemmatimonadota bacterium]
MVESPVTGKVLMPTVRPAAPLPLFLVVSALLTLGCGGGEPASQETARSDAPDAASREPPASGTDSLVVGQEARERIRQLAEDEAVARALEHVRADHGRTVDDQVSLAEIPAPPFEEDERAEAYAAMFRAAGADTVHRDDEGNVIAVRRGAAGGRVIVVSGHLDTVFPPGTDVTVSRSADTLFAPGIGDDARGLAVVLAVLRALEAADVETEADVWFVGTVGEEGLGDLRGVKHLFRDDGPPVDVFFSVDGTDLGQIVNRALGSRRYRVTFRGPGGHSWGAFGLANPAHALGRAIENLDGAAGDFVSEGPRTSYNVGRLGGGTAINAIPFEAWMEVDMRSVDQPRLMHLDSLFRARMDSALAEENRGRGEGPELEIEVELVGDRPSGEIPAEAPVVQHAAATALWAGAEPVLERSSTDANIAISRDVPAVTIGGGGEGQGAHSLDEWWRDTGDAHVGIQRVLLLTLAEAGLATPEPVPEEEAPVESGEG